MSKIFNKTNAGLAFVTGCITLLCFIFGKSSLQQFIPSSDLITPKPNKFVDGDIYRNKYYNPFFGVTIEVPINWEVRPKQYTDTLKSISIQLLKAKYKDKAAELDITKSNYDYLFIAYKYSIGTITDYDPSITVMGDNVEKYPGIKSGKEYLFSCNRYLNNLDTKDEFIIESRYQECFLGGKQFFFSEVGTYNWGVYAKERTYATIIKGNALIFIISYVTDDQLKELEKILVTVKFKI